MALKVFVNNEKISTYTHIPYSVKEEDRDISRKACIDFITLFVLLEVPYFLYFGINKYVASN